MSMRWDIMTNPVSLRSKARGYLRQADSCGDELLADELRGLARRHCEEAERLEQGEAARIGVRP